MNPPGEPLLEKYDPAAIESVWYRRWESEGAFHAEPDPTRPPFVIPMPPPNITGRAHMGHGSTYTVMDILTRYHRMRGDNAVWLPGQDHAAIATQNVIEKELAAEGLTRFDLGPERFRERAAAWRDRYGHIIYEQFRALGFSPDWLRDRYTMDAGFSRAVVKVFVDLHREGLIYRGTRLINWCPHCRSTLSDSEVEREDVAASLVFVRYPDAEGGDGIVVATTRPETIFADEAVAVHPDDPRYRHMVGRRVRRPLSPALIPVIADAAVDREFGTGAVKITPGHDQTDAEIGERHGLPARSVIDVEGRMTSDVEPAFAGLDRAAARRLAVTVLAERGHLVREEPHTVAQGVCYRCGTAVEPLLSLQWFVKMAPLAEPALAATRSGRLRFVPERYTRIYEDWLERIRDWCISRQIWLGHRLPVWVCPNEHMTVAPDAPSACSVCGDRRLTQVPDTLDTWFSSALWPFGILGWPDATQELRVWYPAQLLVTAREIIFLWVARMVMMGLHFMGREPFETVFIAPLILDEQGRKMSKSLGTSTDPMDLVQRYGADATRLGIVGQMHGSQDVRFSEERCDAARRFGNKIWQATRFALRTFPELAQAGTAPPLPSDESLTLADRWILDALAQAAHEVDLAAQTFDFAGWGRSLHVFLWNRLCDVYIEIAKDRGPTRAPVLAHALSRALELLHPIMPFITEELWQHLPHAQARIEQAPWPLQAGRRDEEARREMGAILQLAETVLSLRAVPKLPRSALREVVVAGASDDLLDAWNAESAILRTLAGVSGIRALGPDDERPPHALSRRMGTVEVLLPVEASFLERERSALRSEIESQRAAIAELERKLGSRGFLEKAPPSVVEKEKARLEALRTTLAISSERLASL